MKKILVISSYSKSLVNFRGEMLRSFIKEDYKVWAAGPDYNSDTSDTLSNMGIQYMTYYLQRTGTSLFNDIKSYHSLKNLINQVEPDLVLSYTIKPVIYGSLAAKRSKITKIYSMITGLGNAFNNSSSIKARLLSYLTEVLYKIALKNIDGVIFQNLDDKDVFIQKGIIDKKQSYRIHGSGVNLNEFPLSKPKVKPVTFLFIGRLLKEKGINDFIEAAKIIKGIYPKTRFVVVGGVDSNPTSYTVEDFKNLEKSGLIEFVGGVDDVRPYLENASVFVLPSYYGEGTPRTALESMSMGKPLIMTDSVGCRETVKDGKNGFLVPIKSPDEIAKAMEKFVKEPKLIAQMGAESRRFAEEVYDVRKVNEEIHQILGL